PAGPRGSRTPGAADGPAGLGQVAFRGAPRRSRQRRRRRDGRAAAPPVHRAVLRARPSATVFAVAHALAQRLLERGHVVIVDATNLRESHRAPLYALAKAASAPAILVRVVAPESAIRERLTLRAARSSPADASDADWAIY